MQVEVIEEHSDRLGICPPPPGYTDVQGWLSEQQERMETSWRATRTYWRDATADEACPARLFSSA